jgi:hypothetical protein
LRYLRVITSTALVLLLASSAFATDGATGEPTSLFRWERANALVFAILFAIAILWSISQAKRGKKLYIRPINGLSAMDDAVGRATEMGKPVYFIPGTGELDEILTIAGMTVLGHVAHLAARARTTMRIPVLYPLALAAARETVEQSYRDEGNMDPLDPQTVQYVAGESFSYSARVGGMMSREQPAAAIYMGQFHAESLLIAEMGNSVGAIQIAGTSEPEQLPFFIAACDYTIMGEEFYAATAYLSNEPRMLGALRGQDIIKIVVALVILAGVVSATFGWGHEFWDTILNAE